MLEVVQLRKDAHLRELGDTCDEDEFQICPLVLKHLIELTEHSAHVFQLFLIVEKAHHRRIIFVENNHYLIARLLESMMNKVTESVTRSD